MVYLPRKLSLHSLVVVVLLLQFLLNPQVQPIFLYSNHILKNNNNNNNNDNVYSSFIIVSLTFTFPIHLLRLWFIIKS